ncbi:hypothetical protein [Chamaesiphon sp.]|uniref:hypothetical protein n=1 Tax=Chamaesiphon sp. TaxID=2814140 RepID=UPI003593F141
MAMLKTVSHITQARLVASIVLMFILDKDIVNRPIVNCKIVSFLIGIERCLLGSVETSLKLDAMTAKLLSRSTRSFERSEPCTYLLTGESDLPLQQKYPSYVDSEIY